MEQVYAAIVGAVVGGIITYQVTKILDRRKYLYEAKLAVQRLIHKMKDSRFYSIPPDYEVWSRGFESLKHTRDLFREAKSYLKLIDNNKAQKISNIVDKFYIMHQRLIELEDSFQSFVAEKNLNEYQRIRRASEWTENPEAVKELEKLQRFYDREIKSLEHACDKLMK